MSDAVMGDTTSDRVAYMQQMMHSLGVDVMSCSCVYVRRLAQNVNVNEPVISDSPELYSPPHVHVV